MKTSVLLERTTWVIRTHAGGEVSITKREEDFLIKHGDMISQCPHEWFRVGGNLDTFNELSSENNQSCISIGMGNPETGLSLLSINIDRHELADIKLDGVLSKFLDIGKLDRTDCVF